MNVSPASKMAGHEPCSCSARGVSGQTAKGVFPSPGRPGGRPVSIQPALASHAVGRGGTHDGVGGGGRELALHYPFA